MTFLLFAPASTKWLGWRKTKKIPKEELTIGRFCDIYCAMILRYYFGLSVCGAVFLKVMDQKTLVKRRWSYNVRRTVYILTLSEFARHEFRDLWLETFSWTLPDTLSLSLTGIRLGQNKQDEWMIQQLAYHQQNDERLQKFADHQILSNVLLISEAYFPANKMN